LIMQSKKTHRINDFDAGTSGGTWRMDESDGCHTRPAKNSSSARAMMPRITVAEERVLRWVSRGKSNKEIASILGLSPATVKRHLEKILMKSGMRNRVELAIYGLTDSCPHQAKGGCALRQFGRDSES